MGRLFPLAGLLRLRHLQQDRAATDLAAANKRLKENAERRTRARGALAGTATEVANSTALRAAAVARASTRGMLADLEALATERVRERDLAQSAFDAARTRSIGLEKLEDKHVKNLAAEELHSEQKVLDEIASVTWHRRRNEDTE
jgi:flagellar protein FliJ